MKAFWWAGVPHFPWKVDRAFLCRYLEELRCRYVRIGRRVFANRQDLLAARTLANLDHVRPHAYREIHGYRLYSLGRCYVNLYGPTRGGDILAVFGPEPQDLTKPIIQTIRTASLDEAFELTLTECWIQLLWP